MSIYYITTPLTFTKILKSKKDADKAVAQPGVGRIDDITVMMRDLELAWELI